MIRPSCNPSRWSLALLSKRPFRLEKLALFFLGCDACWCRIELAQERLDLRLRLLAGFDAEFQQCLQRTDQLTQFRQLRIERGHPLLPLLGRLVGRQLPQHRLR